MRFFSLFLAFTLVIAPAVARAQLQPSDPSGLWRCVMNSNVVSIDLQMQVYGNQTLQHQGSIVYVQTGRIFNVRGGGRWLLSPPDQSSNQYQFGFQMHPAEGNHAIFSIFARPTGDPNFLNNRFQEPQGGSIVETACQRIG